MPVLLDLRGQVQVNPEAKAKLLASSFFPDRLNLQRQYSIPDRHVLDMPEITVKMMEAVISKAKPYSALGASGIPNDLVDIPATRTLSKQIQSLQNNSLEETMEKAIESTMVTLFTEMLEASGALPEHHYGGCAD
ncbi:hypothetical protein IW262DRAFT_1453489 [Armillaria fumosa]|nr:hypothetical protein IW262DRAFT_1453489 [Armillaria fumosa]